MNVEAEQLQVAYIFTFATFKAPGMKYQGIKK